jgi:hypothetical protein
VAFGFEPENLVQTLTNSFAHFLDEGVSNGVLTQSEVNGWLQQIETQFRNRVNWRV